MEQQQLRQVVLVAVAAVTAAVAVVGPAPALADHVVAVAVEQWEPPHSR
jgi:hypothetical protein